MHPMVYFKERKKRLKEIYKLKRERDRLNKKIKNISQGLKTLDTAVVNGVVNGKRE